MNRVQLREKVLGEMVKEKSHKSTESESKRIKKMRKVCYTKEMDVLSVWLLCSIILKCFPKCMSNMGI